jgi:nucleotide-binding universal stress UspA family protein
MNAWPVLGAIVLVGIVFVLIPVAAEAYARFRRPWRLPCPEEGVEAQIRVSPAQAARAEILGRRDLEITRCSLWPERQRCAQACLGLPAAQWRRPRPGEPLPPRRDGDGRPTILVPLDGSPGSESVVEAAADVARARHARLRLLRVVPPMGAVRVDDRTIAFADQEAARVDLEARAYLRRLADRLDDVDVDCAVRFGEPGTEIVNEAEEVRADVIAMATRDRHRLSRAFRPGVAERVGRGADAPLLLMSHGGVTLA